MKKQLNTNYRLVWSAVQNALIAVSELTHAKGKKTAGIIALSALSSLASIPAFADDSRCVNGTTVTDNCTVEAGETVSNMTVKENGNLRVNGESNNTVLTGQKNPTGSGSSFDDGSRYDSATEWVYGTATGTIINAGGIQKVDGGTADQSKVNYHGVLEVNNGGTITNSTVGSNDAVDGLKTDEAYISVIGNGSSAKNTHINNGGVLSASEGAIVTDTTINAGGRLELSVDNDLDNNEFRTNAGITTANGVTINKDGILALDKDTKATDVAVNEGGILWAENGAILENITTVGGETKVQNATLTGSNVFNQQGTLTVSGDVSAEIIELHDANIQFEGASVSQASYRRSTPEFNAGHLTVKELKGEGDNNNIALRIDAVSGVHDTLKVTDAIDGHFNVNINSQGKEINTSALDSSFIEAKGSDAHTFSGDTDIGAYNYSLYQDGDDWRLQRSGNLSASSSNAMMLANVTPTIWASELSVLRNRLGELHADSEQTGVWLKYMTARNRANNNQTSYKQDMNGFVLGGDRQLEVTDGKLFLGSQFGYSYSSLDAASSDGQVKSYSVGLYATWLHNSGYYVDGVLKGNRFFSENNARFNQGTSKASDATNGIGFSLEGGKHININTYQIEPYVQLAGFQGQKTHYTFDNDLHVNANATRSLKAEIGTTLGKEFTLPNGGNAKPYIRLAASQEFIKNNDVTINNTERFTNDMSGLTGKYGIGMNTNIVKDLDMYGEFNYAKGNKLETPYSGTVGIRYSF